MSIHSNAFGRVVLTGSDAKKFQAQARHGRPKKAAKASVLKGVKLLRDLKKRGAVKLKLGQA